MADRKPGLSGAGGALGEDQFVFLQQAEIGVLRGVARPHAALARDQLLEADAGLAVIGREEAALLRGFLDRAVDVAGRHDRPSAHPVIEAFQHATGLLRCFGGAAHDDLIAVGMGDDAEPTFDMR